MGKKGGVSDARLNVMIRDLKTMKATLLPDDPSNQDQEVRGGGEGVMMQPREIDAEKNAETLFSQA